MEVKKDWTYEEFPEFEMEGIPLLHNTGDEMGSVYMHDIVYAEPQPDVQLHLQILKPRCRNKEGTKWPCVVYVQGSAWFKQYLYGDIGQLARLASRGYVVALVEYRHSGIASFPAPIIDARNAVRFMKVHAEEYSIDPNKVVLAGNSSGGHTAVYGGFMHDDDADTNLFPGVSGDTKGIIDFYGSTSFMFPDSNPGTVNHGAADSPEGLEAGGVDLNENEEMRRAMSAECNVHEDTVMPPLLIFHGTKDRVVNTKCSVLLYEQAKRTGHDAALYLIEKADHGGPEFWTPQVLDIVEKFIARVTEE